MVAVDVEASGVHPVHELAKKRAVRQMVVAAGMHAECFIPL